MGTPVVSIIVAFVVGLLALGPYKSWNQLVNVVTGATAIMYAFAPISLAALRNVDRERERSYRTPMPALVLPAAFCSANLIIYWGGFPTTWKLAAAMLVGLVLFAIGAARSGSNAMRTLKNAIWIAPWFAGLVILGYIGRYGDGVKNIMPEWIDILAVVVFSLIIFYWSTSVALAPEAAKAAIAKDAFQLAE